MVNDVREMLGATQERGMWKVYFWVMSSINGWRSFLGTMLLFSMPVVQGGPRSIPLENPGLEALPSERFRMAGWASWGKGATPDIQPGLWGVDTPPGEGLSYLGLVAREDRSTEGIRQQLPRPLPPDQCLYLTVLLARHSDYSGHRLPLSLRLRGQKGPDGGMVDLATTPPIAHRDWRLYTLEFSAPEGIDRIILEGAPVPGAIVAYRGNILLDGLSAISPCLRALYDPGEVPFVYL